MKSTKRLYVPVVVLGIAALLLLNYKLKNSRHGIGWKSQTKRTSMEEPYTSEKWIVVTTISYPTPDLMFLAQIPDWQVLVVGDAKTPEDWSLKGCIYLSVEDQQALKLHTTRHVPLNSYARKNLGYLFAIAHGAKFIYETDDDNRPLDLLANFILEPSMWTLAFDGEELFNPYQYFGQPTLWPRGYPLSAIGGNVTSDFLFDNYEAPYIQQGVVNGDPDMDAFFRLTRKQTTSRLNVTFDGRAPPVLVPNGVLSPFNSQNTLFLYNALWALLLPVTTTQRVCDIWRSYWSQRLMWEIGGHLAFFPPNAFQKRNAHSYLQDALEEKDLYFETERLLSFLRRWGCDESLSFFNCVIKLTDDMISEDFLKKEDGLLVKDWVTDLEMIRYREPTRINFKRLHPVPRGKISSQPPSNKRSKVTFHAARQVSPSLNQDEMQNHISKKFTPMSKICTASNVSLMFALEHKIRTFPKILLVVVFNFPHYKNIQFLEAMYRSHFPNILYCGSNKREFDKQIGDGEVSFIEVDVMGGYVAYRCLVQAMKMNYNVDGYLYIGDDLLLNVWNVHLNPQDKLWIQKCNVLQKSVSNKWHWIEHQEYGKKRYESAIALLQKHFPDKFSKYINHLKMATGFDDGLCHSWSDIAYVPEIYTTEVILLFEIFSKFNVFVEVVFPTVFYGIENRENIHVIPGSYLGYDGKRNEYQKYFNRSDLFLHPVKLSKALASKTGRHFFCSTVFPLLLT